MILVTGAGGKTGRVLIPALSTLESVSALVHRPEQISVAHSAGAQKVFVGDMTDPSAVHAAMQGARAVYHICANMSADEVIIGSVVIREASSSGIEHFVYHSVLHPQTQKMDHHRQKLLVEEMLIDTPLRYTILQPAPYMQNWLNIWNSIVDEGILRLPYSSETRFSFVDLEDVAEVAKVVLSEPDHAGAIYELSGTPALSHTEVAQIFSRGLNRPVRVEREETGAWRARNSDLSERLARSLIEMFAYYDRYGLYGNSNVLKWILKRDPTSLDAFIERIAGLRRAVH